MLPVRQTPNREIEPISHWQPVRPMKSIASTIWCRGIWAGAPRRPGGSNRSATSSHCSSVKAIAKLMPAIVAARGVSFDGTNTAVRTRTFGHRPSD